MENPIDILNYNAIFLWSFVLVVLLVSAIASILNVRSAKGPRERRFALRSCIAVWAMLVAIIVGTSFIEEPYCYIFLGCLLILFPLLVYRAATRRQLIHELDERDARHKHEAEKPDKSQ